MLSESIIYLLLHNDDPDVSRARRNQQPLQTYGEDLFAGRNRGLYSVEGLSVRKRALKVEGIGSVFCEQCDLLERLLSESLQIAKGRNGTDPCRRLKNLLEFA